MITEGAWKPAIDFLGPLPSHPGAMARVFSEPELPGLLLYDVYAPDAEDDKDDALRAFLEILRAIILGGGLIRRGPRLPPPPPPGNGKWPEDTPEEEEPQRPPQRPPAIDWDSPPVQALKWILILAVAIVVGILLVKLFMVAVAALLSLVAAFVAAAALAFAAAFA